MTPEDFDGLLGLEADRGLARAYRWEESEGPDQLSGRRLDANLERHRVCGSRSDIYVSGRIEEDGLSRKCWLGKQLKEDDEHA